MICTWKGTQGWFVCYFQPEWPAHYILNYFQLQGKGHRAAAANRAYGDRRTMGVTTVNRAADGRRTINLTV